MVHTFGVKPYNKAMDTGAVSTSLYLSRHALTVVGKLEFKNA